MNKVYLIGNVTKDIEVTKTASDLSVARFTIAVKRQYDKEQTDFFNIVAWRTLADTCGKYLKKGDRCAIVGTLQNRSYETKDGDKRSVTEIMLEQVEFLTAKKEIEKQEELQPIDDEDLPF